MANPSRRNSPDNLRQFIDGSALLSKVLTLLESLERGWTPRYEFPRDRPIADLTPQDFVLVEWVQLTNQDLNRLTQVLNFHMKLLNKVLPDLKSVDVHDSTQQIQPISQVELANRLYAAIRRLPNGQQLLSALTAPNIHNANIGLPPTPTIQ